MRDIAAELKSLRLYGMAGAWGEFTAGGDSAALQSSRWLIDPGRRSVVGAGMKKPQPIKVGALFWWARRGSNPGPKDSIEP